MGISRKGLSLFLRRAVLLTLAFLITFSANPLVPATVVNASEWAGWDGMDTIAILSPSDEFLNTSAQELKTYLGKMSGRSWNIVQNDVSSPAIRLQVNPAAPEFANRGDETVRLISDGSGIHIIGKTSIAVRHGAYLLLESLGVHWFFKHDAWTYTPSSLVNIGTIDEIHEPSYLFRYLSTPGTIDLDVGAIWYRRNRLFGMDYYPAAHTYSSIIGIDEYGAHPEYFIGDPPDGSWQLDPENADVLARAVQYARDYIDQGTIQPLACYDELGIGAAQISPRDGGGFSPPYDQSDDQEMTDAVFYLTNEVAKVIGVEYPGKLVSVYNYYLYGNIPSYDLEPNFLAWIVIGTNYSSLTYPEKIAGLYAKGAVVGIREFIDEWVWQKDAPAIDIDSVNRVSWFRTEGATLYTCGTGDGWGGANGLNQYLIGKLLFDHTLDTDDLLDDFYDKAFGPAATVMQHYYETRETDSEALQSSFADLDEAETLAVGNDAVLARIRYLQYYNRYAWLWHNVGIENLTQEECEDFYTFITKIRDLYVIFYRYVEADIRDVLTDTWGLSEGEVDALQDFTEPTAQEASDWMDEALAEFVGYYTPYINPRKIDLVALGNTVEPELDVMRCWFQNIIVPATADEEVTISVKGVGTLQWFDPTGLQIDAEYVNSAADYTNVTFTATSGAGNYILHATRSRPTSSTMWVDVPDRPAAQIANPDNKIFLADEAEPRNAPAFLGNSETYFYVPSGTTDFYFGAYVERADRPIYGNLIEPDDTEHAFNFTETQDMQLDSPAAGIWKLEINQTIVKATQGFWFYGIPPLVWHDPAYLLVQGNSAPVANDQSVITTVDTPINLSLSASDLNGDPLTYAIVTSPSPGILSGTPPVVTYTPNSGFVGSDSFTFKVNDSSADSNLATVSITITDDNYPIADAIGDKSVNEGELLEFTISATDPDGDFLTYSASNLPSGASFDPNNQTFSWAPRYDQAGVYSVHFEVYDGILTDSEDVTITVVQLYEDWDINGDGAANILDMVLVGQHWGETGLTGWIREDANEDGTVNVLDMIIIGQNSTE